MSKYFLRVPSGPLASACDHEIDAVDRERAWKELAGVCAVAAPNVCRDLVQNGGWQIELLDRMRRPIFRISIVGEKVDHVSGT